MEEALKEYLLAEELCRVNCDKPFDMGWWVDNDSDGTNYWLTLSSGIQTSKLPSFYHYIQFAYFKGWKIKNQKVFNILSS